MDQSGQENFAEDLKPLNKFLFAKMPPGRSLDVERGDKMASREAKHWGTPITDHDIFLMRDLVDFQSTDLAYLSSVINGSNHSARTRKISTIAIDERAAQRRRLNVLSLYNIIPQPHIHPSKMIDSYTAPKITPYRKTKPVPIPPRAHPPPLPSPHARSVWLVPICGSLPWDGSTSAIILDSSDEIPSPPEPTPDNQIVWTHAALVSFWSFLLSLRQGCALGSIGLSFYASVTQTQALSYQCPEISDCGLSLENQTKPEFHPITDSGSGIAASIPISRGPLSSVDHIKVYHEAPNAMYIRNVLDAWGYMVPDRGNADKPQKIRMLKGARLVLIDESSKGILIS